MLGIPDPCKEDFSKMTSTERGAFCGKCKIDTFDFRQLSDIQVNTLLFQHKDEHLCGRFTSTQLASLNRGYINWKNQKTRTFKSKFVLALILVFGLSLFSCEQNEADSITALSTITLSQTDTKLDFVHDVMNNPDFDLTDYITDSVAIEEPIACEFYEIDGKIAMPGMVIMEEPVEPFIEVLGGIPMPIPEQTQGALVAPTYEMYLNEIIGDSSKNNEGLFDQPTDAHFDASAYPNPTLNQSTIRVKVYKADQFSIMLYDMNGKLIENVYSGRLSKGIQEFNINLSSQQAGIYLIKVISASQNETVKLQKLT